MSFQAKPLKSNQGAKGAAPALFQKLWLLSADSYLKALFPEELKRSKPPGPALCGSKSRFDFKRSMKKALSAGAAGLVFPEDFLGRKDLKFFVHLALGAGLAPVFQISARRLEAEKSLLKELLLLTKSLQLQEGGRPAGFSGKKARPPGSGKAGDLKMKGLGQPQAGAAPPAHAAGAMINVLFEDPMDIPIEALKKFPPAACLFTCIVTKKNRKANAQKILFQRLASLGAAPASRRLEFYFPYKTSLFDPFLTPKQACHFARRAGAGGQASPERHSGETKGINLCPSDIYDCRMGPDLDLEPLLLPFAENRLPGPKRGASLPAAAEPPDSKQNGGPGAEHKAWPGEMNPEGSAGRPSGESSAPESQSLEVSIIIPSYNSRRQLLRALKALMAQDYPSEKFEVIVVDDGSSDGTLTAVNKLLSQSGKDKNWSVFRFPRVFPKSEKGGFGAAGFRAGIARNLGAKHARGKILAFLDSDILAPPHYLKALRQEHKLADAVMLKRYHLKPKAPVSLFDTWEQGRSPSGPAENPEFVRQGRGDSSGWEASSANKAEELHKKIEPYLSIEDKSYWGRFYETGFSKAKAPWKYVCSYGFSLSRQDFMEAGRFGRVFAFYGFEDTDLGYRLWKAGKRLRLSGLKVYHQPPEKKARRSGFFSRHKALSRTAKIFFYRHLDPEIYRELKTYMRQERGIFYFLPPAFLKRHASRSP